MALRPQVVDRSLAAVIGVGGSIEAVAGSHGSRVWLGIAASTILAVPLAWRRVAPLLPVLVLAGVFVAVIEASGEIPTSAAMFVAWLTASYSVAAFGDLRLALAGLAVSTVLPVVAVLMGALDEDDLRPGDFAIAVVPWAAGRAIRSHRAQSDRLAEATRTLEAEREDHARTAVALERARVARDVHDVVAHTVSAIAVQADAAAAALPVDPEAASQRLERIQAAAAAAVDDLRTVVGGLRQNDTVARPQPGLQDLDALVDAARESGLEVDVTVTVDRLSDGRALAVYRIVQEALTNVRRHANATHAWIEVSRSGHGVHVQVCDDGVGCDGSRVGHGLTGIRERAEAYGGRLEVEAVGGGTRLVAVLPERAP
ncbi:two-component sensor histidine kinase [Mumia zhuanghuii]|uniref:histidine kinase n=2 Tax=Mumia TaxID=1546255 RepID=A0ABW1QHD9_9ACTN|nr:MULTISPECIES: histidine kinase [Mumia]KAA1422846.1 two-component sensor histidine kinase [Mumia zhuanghuii]